MRGGTGQVWIETVIYTLIAFVMIGVVLTFARPKIEEFQDKALLEQSIEMISGIDSTIKEIERRGVGNQRIIKLELNEGSLKISGINDNLVFEMQSRYQYTEPGSDYSEGNIAVQTEKKGELNVVQFSVDYNLKYNITYQQKDGLRTIGKSPTPYNLLISNKGEDSDGRIKINFEIN